MRPGRRSGGRVPLPNRCDAVGLRAFLLLITLLTAVSFQDAVAATARFAIALVILVPLVLRSGGRVPLGRGPLVMGLTGGFLLYLCQLAERLLKNHYYCR